MTPEPTLLELNEKLRAANKKYYQVWTLEYQI
jgi:hypothetical protein